MSKASLSEAKLKDPMKTALLGMFQERRDLFGTGLQRGDEHLKGSCCKGSS